MVGMGKKILVMAFVFVGGLVATEAKARAQCALRAYDRSGSSQGKMESSGKVYGRSGSYQGKMESSGKIFGLAYGDFRCAPEWVWPSTH